MTARPLTAFSFQYYNVTITSGCGGKNVMKDLFRTVLAEGAEKRTCDDYRYVLLEGGSARITGNKGEDAELTIPGELDGHPVREIGEVAFYKCNTLTAVALPEGLTTIGDDVFKYCTDDLTITVSRDSYAHQYVIDNGPSYTYPDANDWLYA